MKKFLCIVLSLLVLLSFAFFVVGCKNDKKPERPEPSGTYGDGDNVIIDTNI